MLSQALRYPMIWVALAMALLWAWGTTRDQTPGSPPQAPVALPVVSAELQFLDGPQGLIEVINARNHAPLASYSAGEGSFLRGILRSLVRERRMRDLEPGGAFHLALLETGSLVISDPQTGYWMALEAFGVDNRRVFAELLEAAQHSDEVIVLVGRETGP